MKCLTFVFCLCLTTVSAADVGISISFGNGSIGHYDGNTVIYLHSNGYRHYSPGYRRSYPHSYKYNSFRRYSGNHYQAPSYEKGHYLPPQWKHGKTYRQSGPYYHPDSIIQRKRRLEFIRSYNRGFPAHSW